MRELDTILHALQSAADRCDSVLLATVVGVEGSVYRGAGARMIVSSGGSTVGAVSGGCLEADIVARAPEVLASGRAQVAVYDTRASDDVILGLGLGCQGLIELLLEPLGGDTLRDAIGFYQRLRAHRDPVTLLTLVRSGSDGPAAGARLVLAEDGSPIEGEPSLLGREGDVAREVVRPAVPLVICGGGTDAIPLAQLAKQMGWHVTVIDHRVAFATPERFDGVNAVVCMNIAQNPELAPFDARDVAVVMAHSAVHDGAYLHALLDAGARYIGVLGPRRRTDELLGGRAAPDSVHSPVGLDLGAESPEEIALAIVAEITAVIGGRSGGMLRNHVGPIHDRGREGQVLSL